MKSTWILTLGLSIALFSCNQNQASKAGKKPNMVFILADDCSYWDLGTYGSKDAITPNIDKLAADGIKFTRAYQAAPMCSPTRHNLYTGLYPVKTGAYPNHTMAKEGTKSIAHYLKPLGYRVALAGKTHVAPKEVFPFEYLKGLTNGDFNPIKEFVKDAKSKEEPFCLFVCSKQPHTPWDKGDASLFPPDKLTLPPFFVDTEDTRENFSNYLAEINYLDGQVGEVLKILKDNGQSDNTLVVFSSEQGNSFPFAKWTCYDVGVHSGFVAKWPGKIKQGSVSDALIEYSDVVPTFVEMAGGTPAEYLDGKSLVNLFLGKTDEHKDYAYSLQTTRGINNGSEHYGIRSVVSDQYRYILNLTPEAAFKNNITQKETWWKTW
jgi:N-sulfoglucosamine sulfohydrolase